MNSRVLDRARARPAAALLALLGALLLPVNLATDLYLGLETMQATLSGAVFLAIAWISIRINTRLRDYVVASAILGQIMVLTALYGMHPWQIDTHFLYAAGLAAIALLGRVRVLLYAGGIVALHHLVLTAFLPSLVFPSRDLLADVMRASLYAGVEAVGLSLAILWQLATRKRNKDNHGNPADENFWAPEARASAEACTPETHDVMALISEHLRRLAHRDLTCAIRTPPPDAFQTSPLVWKAGDEAARTGEVGTGLAVESHDVPQLAQRISQTATGASP